MNKKIQSLFVLIMLFVSVTFTSCEKQYYFDSGLSKAKFEGNMLQYLESNPILFDTLVQVIKLAKLESYFTDSTITFFAPADSSIHNTYQFFNNQLRSLGQDTLTSLSNIKAEFWRNTLMMYMFKGAKGLEDYPQLDLNNKQAFSGEFSRSLLGRTMNIGAVFTDARGLKYKGYRYLNISYVPSESSPYNSWVLGRVATCNINPTNGMVHVLMYPQHYFGFDPLQAYLQATYYGFNK